MSRRVATQEEEDDFEKEMAGFLAAAPSKPAGKQAAADAKPMPSLGTVLRTGTGASRVAAQADADAAGALTLRVLGRGSKANKLEAKEVLVPRSNPLAQTVLKMDEQAHLERQQLKRQILAASEDHEAAPRGYIPQIRQEAVHEGGSGYGGGGARSGGKGGATKTGNYN